MYGFWNFFLSRRNFSYLLLIALSVAGLYSIINIPKESAPEVQIPVGVVTVVLPGASASDIESLVTNKIEDALIGRLENVSSVTSSSQEGVSSVVVEFNASADIDASVQDLKDEIDTVKSELPDEALDPIVSDINFVNQPILTFAVGGEFSSEELGILAKKLDTELSAIRGVSDVQFGGNRDRQVSVIVRKESLAAYGLNIGDIVGALARGNAKLPVGTLEVSGVRYALQFEGDIENPSDIRDLAILSRNGIPVYVRDVADVFVGLSPETSISRVSIASNPSVPALTVSVFKRTGGNITEIADAVSARMSELSAQGGILDGATVLPIYDSGDELKKDLLELSQRGIETIILVMVVLFITVGWREALVAGISIPISFLIAFIGLDASGNTLNFVSLFSLILAVGILVDAGIVVVESMYTFITRGSTRREASFDAVKTYQSPLTAGIMTTVAAFVPLFFISGVTGEFIATIPFTIIFVLVASLFVALVFVPIIGASTLSIHHLTEDEKTWQDRAMERLQAWYKGFLGRVFDDPRFMRRIKRGLIAGFFISLLFPFLGLVKVIFFPGEDIGFITIDVELPEGTPLWKTDLELRKIEEFLYEAPHVEAFSITAGGSSQFGNNPVSGGKFGNVFVKLEEGRDMSSSEIVADLRDRLANIRTSVIRVSEPASGPPVGTPVVIKFLGDDLEAIAALSDRAGKILETIPGTTNITTSTKDDGTVFSLTIDKAKASALGIDASTVATTLRIAVSGAEATTINTKDDDVDVMVFANLNPAYRDPQETIRTTADALKSIEIVTQMGKRVPLGSIVTIQLTRGSATIRHEDGDRLGSANSDLSLEGNAREIAAIFKERAASELTIPEGVRMEIGGENEEVDQSFTEMFYALIAGVVLMLAVLMYEFNSLRHSLYVLSIVPLTLIGIMVGLAITRLPLSFPSLLGFIALSGIIVNHTILLIDVINHLRKEKPERPIRDVIIEGAALRLRPITLTNITTIVGMLPLALSGGLWGPLAVAIMFGLMFAAVVTLLLVPILYYQKPGSVEI